jgi:hypothetical protein
MRTASNVGFICSASPAITPTFTRCGELNLNGMVDAQIAMLEGELFGGRHGCVLVD